MISTAGMLMMCGQVCAITVLHEVLILIRFAQLLYNGLAQVTVWVYQH